MILFSDPRCLEYGKLGHPEAPFRVRETVKRLEQNKPDWRWGEFGEASEKQLLRAHTPEHLQRLKASQDFDGDTPHFSGIDELARLSAGSALAAMETALEGGKAISVMRPPGHHAEREKAMGFCYLNNIAVCALEALDRGLKRVAVWDFDAHHCNGTEAILYGVEGTLVVSIHQHPCYPGTGSLTRGNCYNYPVAPMTHPAGHMEMLELSWEALREFEPELVLVSAGFDAYVDDPITEMTLRKEDFRELGVWLNKANLPTAAMLEGGYSEDLPELVEAFLEGWES